MNDTYTYNEKNVEYIGIKNTQIRIGQKISASMYNVDKDGNIISNNPIINAIDIDWNNATAEGLNSVIKTTSDLLNELSDAKKKINDIKIPTSIYELAGGTNVLTTENFEIVKDQLTGKSAYQIAKETAELAGIAFPYSTESSWVASLKGEKGNPGNPGSDGLSAYQIAKIYNPDIGTEQEWINSLQGLSAYQIAARTYSMLGKEFPYANEVEWMEDLMSQKISIDDLDTLIQRINTIFGNNTQPINDIISNKVTELLVPDSAKESLDTLREISDWIQQHPEDAAAFNSSIARIDNTLNDYTTEWNNLKNLFAYKGDIYELDEYGNQKLKTMLSGKTYAETLEDVNILLGQISFAQNVEDNAEQNVIVDITSENQEVKIKNNLVDFLNENDELTNSIKLIAASYDQSNRTITLGLNTDATETILNKSIDLAVSESKSYVNEKLKCKII